MGFIEELRERPEEERLAFAGFAAGAVVLTLFLIWGFLFFNGNRVTAFVEVTPQQASVIEGIQTAGDEFRSVSGELSEQYDELERVLGNVEEMRKLQQAIELSVDENGDVTVDNVIVPRESFNTN